MMAPVAKYGRAEIVYLRGGSGKRGNSRVGEGKGFLDLVRAKLHNRRWAGWWIAGSLESIWSCRGVRLDNRMPLIFIGFMDVVTPLMRIELGIVNAQKAAVVARLSLIGHVILDPELPLSCHGPVKNTINLPINCKFISKEKPRLFAGLYYTGETNLPEYPCMVHESS